MHIRTRGRHCVTFKVNQYFDKADIYAHTFPTLWCPHGTWPHKHGLPNAYSLTSQLANPIKERKRKKEKKNQCPGSMLMESFIVNMIQAVHSGRATKSLKNTGTAHPQVKPCTKKGSSAQAKWKKGIRRMLLIHYCHFNHLEVQLRINH